MSSTLATQFSSSRTINVFNFGNLVCKQQNHEYLQLWQLSVQVSEPSISSNLATQFSSSKTINVFNFGNLVFKQQNNQQCFQLWQISFQVAEPSISSTLATQFSSSRTINVFNFASLVCKCHNHLCFYCYCFLVTSQIEADSWVTISLGDQQLKRNQCFNF